MHYFRVFIRWVCSISGCGQLISTYSNYLLVDPSIEEEKVLTGHLYIVMNIHREICTLQLEGVALQHDEVILKNHGLYIVQGIFPNLEFF